MKQRIFVVHHIPEKPLVKLREEYDVEVWPKKEISVGQLKKKVKGAVAIVGMLTVKIDKGVMVAAGPQLKVIANYAVGFNNIDVDEATKRGIVVTNTPGVLTEAVAEHVIALTLAVSRRVVEGDRFVRAGKYHGWDPDLLIGRSLRGGVMGIVGLGRIGRWTARLSKAVGMEVMYNSHTRDEEFEVAEEAKYGSLSQVLERADVVSVSVPLCEETFHMIGKKELGLMKPTAFLINTARGEVVDEKALIWALDKKVIAGAALDVFEHEQNISKKLWKYPNVVLTPHIAGDWGGEIGDGVLGRRGDNKDLIGKNAGKYRQR